MSTTLQDLARKAGEAGYCNIPALLEYMQAAYSQGYKDALTAVAEKAEREAPALDDGMYGGIATHALQEFAKRVRSLPIPEAQK